MESKPQYISLQVAPEHLSLSPKTLYEWVTNRKIPAYKLGRVWRFDRQELDRFVRASSMPSTGGLCYNLSHSLESRAAEVRRKEVH